MIEKRLSEIQARKLEIRKALTENAELDLEVTQKELDELEVEARSLNEKLEIANKINAGEIQARTIEKPKAEIKEERKMENKVFTVESPEFRTGYLKNLMDLKLEEVEERALTSVTNSAGAAIPTQTMNMIIDKLRQTSILFNRIQVSYIAGNVSFVVAGAKNDASFKAEGVDGTAADDTVVSVNLTGYELIKLVEMSAKVKVMSIDAFEKYIVDEIGRRMQVAIENTILNGAGSASNEPTGILDGVTWDGTNSGTFTKTGMTYKDLVKFLSLLPTMYHQNAIIALPRALFFNEIIGMTTDSGEPVVVQNPQAPMQFNVLGYPAVIDDYAPADTMILGDFNYYRMNFAQNPTIESDKSAGFKSGKVIYRGLAVVDGKPALSEAFVKFTRATA